MKAVFAIRAVITGDVINSAEFVENEIDYGACLQKAFDYFENDYEEIIPLPVDQFRGDQFQVLLDKPSRSLSATLYLYCYLASCEPPIQTRLSFAVGEISKEPEERVSQGDGTAFQLSGTNLEEMADFQRIMIQFALWAGLEEETEALIEGSSFLLSAVVAELNPKSAGAIWYKLRGFTQQEIAHEMDRSQGSVSNYLRAGHWKEIHEFLSAYENLF